MRRGHLVQYFNLADDSIHNAEGGKLLKQAGIRTQDDILAFKKRVQRDVKANAVKGFVEMHSQSSSSHFKFIHELNKKPKHVQGTICKQAQYKKESLVSFIKSAQPTFEPPAKKCTKTNLCEYYQYALRATDTLLRPRFWKVYKDI